MARSSVRGSAHSLAPGSPNLFHPGSLRYSDWEGARTHELMYADVIQTTAGNAEDQYARSANCAAVSPRRTRLCRSGLKPGSSGPAARNCGSVIPRSSNES